MNMFVDVVSVSLPASLPPCLPHLTDFELNRGERTKTQEGSTNLHVCIHQLARVHTPTCACAYTQTHQHP